MIDIETLNSLLFSTNNGLLLSICRNLIYDIEDLLCIKNASIVLNYFSNYGKIEELFLWAFKEENCNLKTAYLEEKNEVEFNKFYSIFSRVYSLQEINEFQRNICKPIIETPEYFDQLNIELLKSPKEEFTEEMIEMSNQSLGTLREIILIMIESMKNNIEQLPKEYCSILKYIIEHETANLNKQEIQIIYEELFAVFIQQSIVPFLQNEVLLRKMYKKELIDQNINKIKFIAETFKTFQFKSNESYVLLLRNCIDENGLSELFNNIINQAEIIQHPKPFEQLNNLILLLHSSILPIKRNLSHEVSAKLLKALEIPACCYDDFLVYNKLIQNIANFTMNYYHCFRETLDKAEAQSKELEEIKSQIENAKKELKSKKLKNCNLQIRLDDLKSKNEQDDEMDVMSFLREMAKEKQENQRLVEVHTKEKKDKKHSDKKKEKRKSFVKDDEIPVARSLSSFECKDSDKNSYYKRESCASVCISSEYEEKKKNRLSRSFLGFFDKKKKEKKSGDESGCDSSALDSSETVYPVSVSANTPSLRSNVHL
ncbi:hypothetical protein ENUP19_0050G0043 [Entamoeba nuttalli]